MCPAKALSLPVAVCVQEEEKKKTFSENRTVSGRSVFEKMVSSSSLLRCCNRVPPAQEERQKM